MDGENILPMLQGYEQVIGVSLTFVGMDDVIGMES
jgi:hypothetical protein